MDSLESRVTDLEIQITHQEQMLEDLNSVLILQQKKIDSLNKISNSMVQAVRRLSDTNKISQ